LRRKGVPQSKKASFIHNSSNEAIGIDLRNGLDRLPVIVPSTDEIYVTSMTDDDGDDEEEDFNILNLARTTTASTSIVWHTRLRHIYTILSDDAEWCG